jgi:hypothetical protein
MFAIREQRFVYDIPLAIRGMRVIHLPHVGLIGGITPLPLCVGRWGDALHVK